MFALKYGDMVVYNVRRANNINNLVVNFLFIVEIAIYIIILVNKKKVKPNESISLLSFLLSSPSLSLELLVYDHT